MGKEVLNLQRHRDSWTGDVFRGQSNAQCSQERTHGQMQQRWDWRNGTKCMSGSFILSWQCLALVTVGMQVLAQVTSACSCESNWSAHGHIQSEVRNRLAPATTEKQMYIYSNRKAGRGQGRAGRAGRGALISSGGAGRGALVSAPQRPCQPSLAGCFSRAPT